MLIAVLMEDLLMQFNAMSYQCGSLLRKLGVASWLELWERLFCESCVSVWNHANVSGRSFDEAEHASKPINHSSFFNFRKRFVYVFVDCLSYLSRLCKRDINKRLGKMVSKQFRKCLHLCPCYITDGDSCFLSIVCLAEEWALKGASCVA